MRRGPGKIGAYDRESHYIIDGTYVRTVPTALRLARSKGFTGSIGTIEKRLRAGCTTWADLIKPTVGGTNLPGYMAKSRKEMHAICAELDARKAAMAQPKDEEE